MLDEFPVDKGCHFPDHPHCGFGTETFILEGQFQHEDIAGYKGTIGPGACSGRLLSCLPEGHKKFELQYQELLDGQILLARPQHDVVVKVIASLSHEVKSQIYTHTPTMFHDFKLNKNKTVAIEGGYSSDKSAYDIYSGGVIRDLSGLSRCGERFAA
ncbi:hypothetical protein F5H01DRAFT_417599 [Linnemannia elongata]|nr:hypothetical protein F5H01DRAFT_417599 [Linnemannia elongata]